jgi:geranylgeranyl diphosphate synthase type I
VTGKPVGDDLREGKPTPLLARAVARASEAQRAVLDGVGRPGLGDGDVAAIQQVILDTGARADLEAAIEALAAEAVAALDDVELLPTARRELAALAEFVVLRAI